VIEHSFVTVAWFGRSAGWRSLDSPDIEVKDESGGKPLECIGKKAKLAKQCLKSKKRSGEIIAVPMIHGKVGS
jgi:hypothetical protein